MRLLSTVRKIVEKRRSSSRSILFHTVKAPNMKLTRRRFLRISATERSTNVAVGNHGRRRSLVLNGDAKDDLDFRPARVSIRRLTRDFQLFEYACQEGNYAKTNILSGARAAEKK